MNQSDELKNFCKTKGADLAGIADLAPFKQGWQTLPADLLFPYTRAISVAVRLDDPVVDTISSLPTADYAEHYRSVNATLDSLTVEIGAWIRGRSYSAEAVPASKIMDTEKLLGALSHKAIARMAGIGWQGKSLLIISPQFGPRIRLATVLTKMPLQPDGPLSNRCGACTECTDACPVRAIRNVSTKDRYYDRDEALFFDKCAGRTYENSLLPGIGARICGVCVRVCPQGKQKRKA